MDLQKIVVLCVVVAVLGGGFWYLQSNKTSDKEEAQAVSEGADVERDEVAENELEPFAGFGSFASLMGLGKSITCDFSYSDEGGTGSGTSYFAGDRMRVDSVTNTEGETIDSHMISDGEYVYTWTTGAAESYAIKMPVPEEDDMAGEYGAEYDTSNLEEPSQMTSDQEVEYDCNRWSVDASVFVPPSDVEFMDMAEMFNNMFEGLEMPEGMEVPEGFPMPQ